MTGKTQLPKITSRQKVAQSRLFTLEQVDLTFSNGETREYERMYGSGRGAVMMVPMKDPETMILVREYCAGTHTYELGFPKGLIDPNETPEHAANRELKEEIGCGTNHLIPLQTLTMAPAFFSAQMSIFLAEKLYPEQLIGDEPEPLEIVEWKVQDYKKLLIQTDFNEARSVAALMLAVDYFRGK
jgi:ADP-ribose diphosphatase